MVRPYINIARVHMNQLKDEFGVTRQTIHSALSYYRNSEMSRKIRARAIELLEQELEKVLSYED